MLGFQLPRMGTSQVSVIYLMEMEDCVVALFAQPNGTGDEHGMADYSSDHLGIPAVSCNLSTVRSPRDIDTVRMWYALND